MMMLWCIFIILCGFSTVQGQGRTYIGYAGSTAVPVLRFSPNDPAATIVIPVYLQIINATDPAVAATLAVAVQVSCELSYPVLGFSRATFGTTTVIATNTNSSVSVSNVIVGRAVDVRCFGVSATGGEFAKATSVSQPVVFTVVSPPVVSICIDGDITVQNRGTTQSFDVQLSDPAVSPVTVTCQPTPAAAAAGVMTLTFTSPTVPVNLAYVNVSYTLGTAGTPVQVICSGQSQTGGTQYVTASSAGGAVTFTMIDPQLQIYPKYMVSTFTSFRMLLLVEDRPDTGMPSLACGTSLYNTTQGVDLALANPTPNCPSTTTTSPTTTPAPTGNPVTPSTVVVVPEWAVQITTLNINSMTVNVIRNIGVTAAVTEYVVVTCCSFNSTIVLEDAAFVTVQLTPNITLDWTQATALGLETDERKYQNPAYVDISPCPCDLTSFLCDIHCCCDSECSVAQVSSFSYCVAGLAGGFDAPLPEYDCYSTHPLKEDWFPLMCVERQYNALLGFFYSNSLNIRATQTFDAKIAGLQMYSYTEEESRTAALSDTVYLSGSSVTVSQAAISDAMDHAGPLVLPHRVLSGQCTLASPVQYLVDTTSDCLFDFTEAACSVDGSFNALFYVESTNTRDPACPKPFIIRGNNGVASQTITVTSVNYHCTSDFTGYIKDTTITRPVRPTASTTFNYTMPPLADQDSCGNDIVTDFNAIATSTSDDAPLPPRCAFDDGYTGPSTPAFDTNTKICSNAVLEVRYKIYWSASQIVSLNATVIIGNIPIDTVVTQKYSSEFVHSFSGNISQDDYQRLGTSFDRSGRPGYDLGKPLLTGSAMTLPGGAFYVNQNTSRQHSLWSTDVAGLCYNAGRRPVLFGENTFTSCDIYLTAAELLGDCDGLRRLLINRLNNLLAADRIGRYGNNNPYDSTHWITFERGNLSYVCERPENLTDADVIARESSGMCTDVVTGIMLEIMYAETGRSNNQPIYEVIGAHVSYTNITLNMTCGTSGDAACQGTGVQAFPIYSGVNYVKVAAQTPVRLDKWEEEYPDYCNRDVCWEELIYPLSSAYDGDTQFAIAMVLIIILFLVGYLMVIRPWWSINI